MPCDSAELQRLLQEAALKLKQAKDPEVRRVLLRGNADVAPGSRRLKCPLAASDEKLPLLSKIEHSCSPDQFNPQRLRGSHSGGATVRLSSRSLAL
jgi:hypothetical protein